MPLRRKQIPSVPEPKDLTLEDIETGIRKFRRRIDEVQAIDPTKTRYDAPQVETATRNIHADLIEVFSKGSQEYFATSIFPWATPRGPVAGGIPTTLNTSADS